MSADDTVFKDIARRVVPADNADSAGDAADADSADAVAANAQELVARAHSDGNAQGARDMRNLALAIGLPMPRILFESLVMDADVDDATRRRYAGEIKKMTPIVETGCMQVEFTDRDRQKRVAFLVLDRCGPEHDLGAQLDKLYDHIPESRRPEILKHLSMLVQLGRSAYEQMYVHKQAMLDDLAETFGDEPDLRVLRVDPRNTTFYVSANSQKRVGIYVKLREEIA
jgi:hypothetical protein